MQIELAYINTKHPDFHEASLIQRALNSGDLSGSEKMSNSVNASSVSQAHAGRGAGEATSVNAASNANNLRGSVSNLNING